MAYSLNFLPLVLAEQAGGFDEQDDDQQHEGKGVLVAGEFRQEGEWFIMDKMNRRCPELSIRNGVTNDEHIIVGDKDYALAELMPLEKELHLYVAPLWKAYWMKKEIRS